MPYEGIGNKAEEGTAKAINEALHVALDDFYPARDAKSAIQIEVIVNGNWEEDFMVTDDAPYAAIVDAVFEYYPTRDWRWRPHSRICLSRRTASLASAASNRETIEARCTSAEARA